MPTDHHTARTTRARGLLARLGRRAPIDPRTSILAHLQALLNTRRGESIAAPGLGLGDFADVVHGFPASLRVLAHGIREMILEHEPRLASVTVVPVEGEDEMSLAFEISAELAGCEHEGPLRLRTDLSSSGHYRVRGE